MKERPILFSTAMAVATVEDRKDQTRRIIEVQPPNDQYRLTTLSDSTAREDRKNIGAHQWAIVKNLDVVSRYGPYFRCPYGVPGDRLWGRETFYAWGRWETRFDAKLKRNALHFVDQTLESGRSYLFTTPNSDNRGIRGGVIPQWWKRPAIFMPRVASRILREIVSIKVEPVQEISAADCIAEGLIQWSDPPRITETYYGLTRADAWETDPRKAYARLWDLINGKRAPWESNPYVWAIKYKQVDK